MPMTVKEVIVEGILVSFSYIDIHSQHYRDAAALRYSVFYKEFDLDPGIINDSCERSSIHLAAVINEEVAGYGRLSVCGSTVRISQMAVQKERRGKKIGSHLMNILIDRSKQEGCRNICLDARVDAVSFYRRFGFKTIGDEFPSKKTGIAHIRMEKKLTV